MPTITGGNTTPSRLCVPSAGAAAAAAAAPWRAATSRRTLSATAAAAAADELPPTAAATTCGRCRCERVAVAGNTSRKGATPGSNNPGRGRPTMVARAGRAGLAAAAAAATVVAPADVGTVG